MAFMRKYAISQWWWWYRTESKV